MSKYIQIPNQITDLKHEEALIYAHIRNQIKTSERLASMPIQDILHQDQIRQDHPKLYQGTDKQGLYVYCGEKDEPNRSPIQHIFISSIHSAGQILHDKTSFPPRPEPYPQGKESTSTNKGTL